MQQTKKLPVTPKKYSVIYLGKVSYWSLLVFCISPHCHSVEMTLWKPKRNCLFGLTAESSGAVRSDLKSNIEPSPSPSNKGINKWSRWIKQIVDVKAPHPPPPQRLTTGHIPLLFLFLHVVETVKSSKFDIQVKNDIQSIHTGEKVINCWSKLLYYFILL